MRDKLEKRGFHYVYLPWPRSKPTGSILSRMFRKSLKMKYLDLTPNNFDDLKYYESRRGGDIPLTILHTSKDLIRWNYPLTKKEMSILNKLIKWAELKTKYNNVTIKIIAENSCLEKAYIQRFLGKKYLTSPFGSFNNFSKQINKLGYEIYKPILTGKEEYYLRFNYKISKKYSIQKMKKTFKIN